jgi:hypothetical protein
MFQKGEVVSILDLREPEKNEKSGLTEREILLPG